MFKSSSFWNVFENSLSNNNEKLNVGNKKQRDPYKSVYDPEMVQDPVLGKHFAIYVQIAKLSTY